MTKSIYDQFDSATGKINAYAVFKGSDYIGRIVVKYPKDGAGRVYVYVQEWGFTMVRGFAGGYGYDKVGAAVAAVYENAKKEFNDELPPLFQALESVTYDGQWRTEIGNKGFTVHNVI